MFKTQKGLLIAGLIFFSQHFVYANEFQNLSKSTYWLGLLNYEKKSLSDTGYKSKVHDKSFFIDKFYGEKDPYKELLANIEQIKKFRTEKITDENYICRFPARSKWLAKKLSIDINDDDFKNCLKYRRWNKFGNIKSISLIFASGYFGNPASFFGHPMLKFNSEKKEIDLLNSIVNFGAITPEKEHPLIYVLKGLFGGYSASFTHKQFFYNSHNYTENELRDLWEYELDLNQQSIVKIVDHFWEIVGKKGAYLFFTENCASKIAEKLNFILDTNLMESPFPQEIPNVLFKNLDEVKKNKKKLYSKISKVPSLRSKLNFKYMNLDQNQRSVVKKIIKNKTHQFDMYINMTEYNKMKINDVLLDFYDLRKLKNKKSSEPNKDYNRILYETLKVKADYKGVKTPINISQAPHQIHGSNLIRIGFGYSEKFNELYKVNIRSALYDNLTTSLSYQKNSELKILDMHFKFMNKKIELEKIDLFSVTSMNSAKTDLPGEFEFSWQIKLGMENQTDVCKHCLVPRLDIGYGVAFDINESLMLFGLLSTKLQDDKLQLGHFELKPNLGIFVSLTKNIKFRFNYAYSIYLDKSRLKEDIFDFEIRLASSLNYDFRISYKEYLDRQTTINASYYW